MRFITLIFLLVAPSFMAAEIRWPASKYDMGTCVTPTNTTWSWYGYPGYIEDIVFSKYLENFAYKITIYGVDSEGTFDLFAIYSIDTNTAQVIPCRTY